VKVTVAPTSITGNANQAPIQVAVKGTDMATIRKTSRAGEEQLFLPYRVLPTSITP
jgi:HAE1 family hydrophobic/amphiphilic exporter-1